MAIDKHEDEIQTSLHGRRFGLDPAGYLVGTPGLRMPYEESTAASTLTAYGLSHLTGTTADHTLGGPPAVGVTKTIVNASSVSTATMKITRSSSAIDFYFSTGSNKEGAVINLLNAGSAVTLIGLTTSRWGLSVSKASSLYFTVTTSS